MCSWGSFDRGGFGFGFSWSLLLLKVVVAVCWWEWGGRNTGGVQWRGGDCFALIFIFPLSKVFFNMGILFAVFHCEDFLSELCHDAGTKMSRKVTGSFAGWLFIEFEDRFCRKKRPGRLIFGSNKSNFKSHRFYILPPLKNHPSKAIGFVYSPLWKNTAFGGRLFRGGRLFYGTLNTSKWQSKAKFWMKRLQIDAFMSVFFFFFLNFWLNVVLWLNILEKKSWTQSDFFWILWRLISNGLTISDRKRRNPSSKFIFAL